MQLHLLVVTVFAVVVRLGRRKVPQPQKPGEALGDDDDDDGCVSRVIGHTTTS